MRPFIVVQQTHANFQLSSSQQGIFWENFVFKSARDLVSDRFYSFHLFSGIKRQNAFMWFADRNRNNYTAKNTLYWSNEYRDLSGIAHYLSTIILGLVSNLNVWRIMYLINLRKKSLIKYNPLSGKISNSDRSFYIHALSFNDVIFFYIYS